LKRGYTSTAGWTAPKPEEKSLRMEIVLDFIRIALAVSGDSGETDVTVIGYCFGGAVAAVRLIFADGPDEKSDLLHHPVDFREMKLFQIFRPALFRRRQAGRQRRQRPPEILSSFEMLRPARARKPAAVVEKTSGTTNTSGLPHVRSMATHLPLAGEYFRTITKD